MKVNEQPIASIAGSSETIKTRDAKILPNGFWIIGLHLKTSEMDKIIEDLRKTTNLLTASLVTILFFGLAAFSQNAGTPKVMTKSPVAKTMSVVLQPTIIEYKSIKIGTTADEVRDKLGDAEIDDKDGFYYRFSDEEFVQIRLDKDNKVRLIAVTYSGENAPKFTDVFGAETNVEENPDGSIYRLIRYPKAGYWVAYSRTAGERPTVTVTMQKL